MPIYVYIFLSRINYDNSVCVTKPLNRFIFYILILFEYIALFCIYAFSTRVSYTTNFTMYLLLIYDVTVINRESCYFAAPKECSGIVYFLFIVTLYGNIKIISNETRIFLIFHIQYRHTVYLKNIVVCKVIEVGCDRNNYRELI